MATCIIVDYDTGSEVRITHAFDDSITIESEYAPAREHIESLFVGKGPVFDVCDVTRILREHDLI
jgi:hypothetical protein